MMSDSEESTSSSADSFQKKKLTVKREVGPWDESYSQTVQRNRSHVSEDEDENSEPASLKQNIPVNNGESSDEESEASSVSEGKTQPTSSDSDASGDGNLNLLVNHGRSSANSPNSSLSEESQGSNESNINPSAVDDTEHLEVESESAADNDSSQEECQMMKSTESSLDPDEEELETSLVKGEPLDDSTTLLEKDSFCNSEDNIIEPSACVISLESFSKKNDLWLVHCPKIISGNDLEGAELNFSTDTKLKVGKYKLQSTPYPEKGTVACVLPSKQREEYFVVGLPVKGSIVLEESVRFPKPSRLEVNLDAGVKFPSELKERHPLLGADYKERLRKALEVSKVLRKSAKRRSKKMERLHNSSQGKSHSEERTQVEIDSGSYSPGPIEHTLSLDINPSKGPFENEGNEPSPHKNKKKRRRDPDEEQNSTVSRKFSKKMRSNQNEETVNQSHSQQDDGPSSKEKSKCKKRPSENRDENHIVLKSLHEIKIENDFDSVTNYEEGNTKKTKKKKKKKASIQ